MPKSYVTDKPVEMQAELSSAEFQRADILFHEVDHSGATFEARIFFNNPDANETTPKTAETGYAGSFHIFGHGGCWGDDGHCDVPASRRPFDSRPPHHMIPAEKVVTITDALKRALESGPNITISVVPVIMSATEKCDVEDPLHFSSFEIATYA